MRLKTLLIDTLRRLNDVVDGLDFVTSGNIAHQLPSIKSKVKQAIQEINEHLHDEQYLYVVTRCEEHSDYVEKVFIYETAAEKYCEQFNNNEDAYHRDITKIKLEI